MIVQFIIDVLTVAVGVQVYYVFDDWRRLRRYRQEAVMYCTRSSLIELIQEVDQINVDNHPVLTELVRWLPTSTIESFMEDVRSALDHNIEEDTTDLDIEDPTEINEDLWCQSAEAQMIRAGISAREKLKKERD